MRKGIKFLSPGIVHSGLTQNPQGNAHASQKLIPKLQVAGVPQFHPEDKPHGAVKVTTKQKKTRNFKRMPNSHELM